MCIRDSANRGVPLFGFAHKAGAVHGKNRLSPSDGASQAQQLERNNRARTRSELEVGKGRLEGFGGVQKAGRHDMTLKAKYKI